MAKRTKSPNRAPYIDPDDPAALDGANLVASEVLAIRRDVLPSIEMIMTADLDDDARTRAVELFRDSLNQPGDPNRDPKVAIVNVQ